MHREELEFLISQYTDGTLRGGDRDALEARLKLDPAARAVLAEYRALDEQLKALPRPAVRWDALAASISAAVAVAEEPAQSYRLADYRWARWVAAAAAVLVVAGTAFVALRDVPPTEIVIGPSVPQTAPAVTVITLGRADADVAPATAPVVVAIGPSDRLQNEPAFNRYAAEVVNRPSQVLIASTARAAQEISLSPF